MSQYGDVVTVKEKSSDKYNDQPAQTKTLIDEVTKFEFENTLRTRNILIVKHSEDGNIEGLSFVVTVNGEVLGTFTTNELGEILIENKLKYNDVVTVAEVTPEPYNATESQTKTLVDELTIFEFENILKRGTVTTTKVDADFLDNKLSGAEFTIFVDVNNNGTYEADVDTVLGTMSEIEIGVYELGNLQFGNYLLKETVAPQYYQIDNNYYAFSITTNGEVVNVENVAGVGFVNNLQTAKLIINKKVESINNIVTLDGFEFMVSGISLNGTEIAQTHTTNENGIIEIQNLLVGTYKISEVENNKTVGFVMPDAQTVTLNTDTDITFINSEVPHTGDITNNTMSIIFFIVASAMIVILSFKCKRKKDIE